MAQYQRRCIFGHQSELLDKQNDGRTRGQRPTRKRDRGLDL
jgi:hypothetical protein